MWGEGRKKMRFHKAELRESSRALPNPGCGWYHVYRFSSVPPSQEEVFYLDADGEDERLVLLLIDIGAFREQEISEEALSYVDRILRFFREMGKQMILRFAYDTEGRGAEREPQSVSLVKQHMMQIGKLIQQYAGDILLVQGCLVGSWGEMHGSKFLSPKAMTGLFNTLCQATAGSCYLAVRTPLQWRTILSSAASDPALGKKLAIFNDGIFGSSTDLGTYGTGSRQEDGNLSAWSRVEELFWQSETLRARPNGGEALWGNPPVGYEQAAKDLAQMHLSYLNSAYDSAQLDYWKKETVQQRGCWNGMSGYAYIGGHLGYRFVIRDVRLVKKTFLEITVENCGFAELCEEAECTLILEEGDGTHRSRLIDTDARSWASGTKEVLRVALPGGQAMNRCRLFLQLQERRNADVIRFANEDDGERIVLGEFR